MKRSTRRGGILLLAAVPVVGWFSVWEIDEARFSPLSLELQKRRSLVMFVNEVPIYQSRWTPVANEVLSFIAESHFVEPAPNPDDRWELVHRIKSGHNGGLKRPVLVFRPEVIAWSKKH